MPVAAKVLIIEDDAVVQHFLRSVLEREYQVIQATSGNDGLAKAAQCAPDIVLLDLGLPDIDGLELVSGLREWMEVPIVVLSSRENESTKVSALDAGADDYLTKPIGIAELHARLRVALRHARAQAKGAAEAAVLTSGSLRIDMARRQVWVNGEETHLTPIEYKLLSHLARNVGRVVRHNDILSSVWGEGYGNEINYLRIYIKHLRRKIEPDPTHPRYILNEPGIGYRFVIDTIEAPSAST
jgi:two-component system KDP operon response regulator KdpE